VVGRRVRSDVVQLRRSRHVSRVCCSTSQPPLIIRQRAQRAYESQSAGLSAAPRTSADGYPRPPDSVPLKKTGRTLHGKREAALDRQPASQQHQPSQHQGKSMQAMTGKAEKGGRKINSLRRVPRLTTKYCEPGDPEPMFPGAPVLPCPFQNNNLHRDLRSHRRKYAQQHAYESRCRSWMAHRVVFIVFSSPDGGRFSC
jgi:hypothetical protein